MTDRATGLVVGLQRLGDAARLKGADLRYMQKQEDDDHLRYLEDLLNMVEKVRRVLLEERTKFMPRPREDELNQEVGQHSGNAAIGKSLHDQRMALVQAREQKPV